MRFSPPKLWLIAFTGFALMIGGWSLAAPYDGSPDEIDHVVRAVGVVSGDVTPPAAAAKHGTGAFQTVPAGLVRTNCWAFDPAKSAACAVPPSADSAPTVAPTGAGRYHPAYYAVVGWPLKWWPGWTGLLLARMVSGLLAAAFLAGAFTALARHRGMLAGLLVAVTPMATYMASAVNPNGVEIAAGVAFFAAIIPLFLGPPDRISTPLLVLAGLSGLALAVLRSSGLLWVVVGAAAVLIPWQSANVRRLLGRRDVWIWLVVVGLAGITSVVWIVAMHATDLGDYTGARDLTTSQAVAIEAENWRRYLDEMVGVTGWLDTRMSTVFYTVWQLLAGGVLLLAVLFASRLDRLRIAILLFGGVAVPALLEVRYANETGFITQGRYLLPILAGLLLFAGFVLDERGLPVAQARSAVRIVAGVLLPIHLVCLLYTLARWQRGLPPVGEFGITSLDPLRGDWHPIVGPVVPLVVETAGLLVVGVLVWVVSARPPPRPPPAAAAEPAEAARPVAAAR